MLSLRDLQGPVGTLVMFLCNHCPFVKHVAPELARLAGDYQRKGFRFVAISSNDVTAYPKDGPAQMTLTAQEWGFDFPYLFDEDQSVARAYEAACTPDFFLFDGEMKLAYRGQLDPSRPGNDIPLTGSDLRGAMDSLAAGRPVEAIQYPSIGCNIKWRS
jgi:thiol-disulfide isomerase/thioredoxin